MKKRGRLLFKILLFGLGLICCFALIYLFVAKPALKSENSHLSEERSESISPEDAEEILIDYYQRVKNRRLAEAEIFWANLLTKGVDEKSIIAIDFKISSPEKNDANLVSKQLSENYSMSITFAEELKTHIVEGTTKPAGLSLTKEQFIGWIDSMSDVSAQYNSIFLTWTFETHEPKMIFESEGIETDLP